jgi:predicted transglutaminase-like cysteine proteinase
MQLRPRFIGLIALASSLVCFIAPSANAQQFLFHSSQDAQSLVESYDSPVKIRWKNMLQKISSYSEERKVSVVNAFFNSNIAYASDMDVWGENDYWATPFEVLDKGRGDCEDFAIAKYYTLLLLGINDSKMRVLYVNQLGVKSSRQTENSGALPAAGGMTGTRDQAHMVLEYTAAQDQPGVILDNLMDSTKTVQQRTDLQMVYGFNRKNLWIKDAMQPSPPHESISKWAKIEASLGLLN